jgi:hypothetical protein
MEEGRALINIGELSKQIRDYPYISIFRRKIRALKVAHFCFQSPQLQPLPELLIPNAVWSTRSLTRHFPLLDSALVFGVFPAINSSKLIYGQSKEIEQIRLSFWK